MIGRIQADLLYIQDYHVNFASSPTETVNTETETT